MGEGWHDGGPSGNLSLMFDDDGLATVQCPYCGEWVEICVDADSEGTMIQDCEVCCQPWQMTVRRTRAGRFSVRVERAQ